MRVTLRRTAWRIYRLGAFVWNSGGDTVFAQEWAAVEENLGPVNHIIAGHCGIPFVREISNGRWINTGVIGMPPNNGESTTRYAVFEEGMITIYELGYDVAGAVRRYEVSRICPRV